MEHQLDDLDQPASVVVGAPSPLVQEILAQLGSRGHHAVSIGGAGFNLDHPDAVEECFAEACGDRRVGVLVHADIPPGAAQPQALMDLDAKGWDLRCESIIRSTLLVFQAAHRRLAAGGSVVLVAPSISSVERLVWLRGPLLRRHNGTSPRWRPDVGVVLEYGSTWFRSRRRCSAMTPTPKWAETAARHPLHRVSRQRRFRP
ncbi:MAG: hypothetical protein R2714_02730 [Microthrixaceae bacterium]